MSRLYRLHYAPDNASLIIRLALSEMGVPFEAVLVDRQTNQHKSPAFRRLNPAGLIPVLETPDGVIFETAAILLWLADHHNGLAPTPADRDRGDFLKWVFFVSNTLHADLRMCFYPEQYVGADPKAKAALRRTVQSRLVNHLALLDDLAANRPVWFSSDAPGVLVYYVACLMRWMALYPADHSRDWFRLSATPALRELLAAVEQRPSVLLAAQAEGLGPSPFTQPRYATPPEGSAT